MRALTTAIIMCISFSMYAWKRAMFYFFYLILILNIFVGTDFLEKDFFSYNYIKLILWFLQYESYPNVNVEERTFQCFYAVQLMCPMIFKDTTGK